jgi:MSHA pilin protein MshA
MRKNQGFTLIELIAVIAILAILAATAIPQFVDLRTQARIAALNGVAGSLASASALNYATRVATNNASGVAVLNCSALTTLVQGVTVVSPGPATGTDYAVAAGALTNGAGGSCVLSDSVPNSVTFTAIGSS